MMRFTVIIPKYQISHPFKKPVLSSELQSHWRVCDSYTAFFSVIGLAPATCDYELRYSQARTNDNCVMREDATNVYRWLTLFLTLPSCVFLIRRFLSKRQWLLLKTSFQSKAQRAIRNYSHWSKFLINLVLELLILLLFPYPSLSDMNLYLREDNLLSPDGDGKFAAADSCLLLSEILYCAMFLRVFFLVRALLNYSGFNDSTARRICAQYDVPTSLTFNLRCMARGHSWAFLLFIIAIAWSVFAIVIRIFERPYIEISLCDFAETFNALWFSINTLYTAPYGDYFPQTHIGRGVSFFMAIISMCIVSVAYTLSSNWLDLSPGEECAFEEIAATRLAARLIESSMRFYLTKKRGGNKRKVEKERREMWRAADEFGYQMPRLGQQIGLSERQISEKYQILSEINFSLWKFDGRLSLNYTKLEANLDRMKRLMQRLDCLLSLPVLEVD